MDRFVPSIIIASIIGLALAGMFFGWRARVRKYSGLIVPDAIPDSIGEVIAVDRGLYVATTLANQPLERVAAHGLGFRSRTTVTITERGIALAPKGRVPFFIGRTSILAVQRATWAIDKAVETGGLIVLTWRLGSAELDSYFRMDDGSEALLHAGAGLIEARA